MVDTPLYFTTSAATPSSTITSSATSTSLETITSTSTSSWCCRSRELPPQYVSQWSKARLESEASASILSEWSSLKAVAATAVFVSNVTSTASEITAAPSATSAVSGGGKVVAELVSVGFAVVVAVGSL